MKNANSISWLLATILLTTAPSSEAQQPAKVPRIGFQLDSPVAAVAARIEGFRQGLRELGYVEGKNIIIEWRSSEGKVERRTEIAAELVRLKVDVIVSRWADDHPRPQRSNFDDSDRYGAGYRSGRQWVRRQPGAAGRQHHGIVGSVSGDEWQTTGDHERDPAETLAHGRHWQFHQPRRCASVTRDGSRGRRLRGLSALPGRPRSARTSSPCSEPPPRGAPMRFWYSGIPSSISSAKQVVELAAQAPAAHFIRQAGVYRSRRTHVSTARTITTCSGAPLPMSTRS